MLGLYPAVVLVLDALRAIRLYGDPLDDRRQRELVRRLIGAV